MILLLLSLFEVGNCLVESDREYWENREIVVVEKVGREYYLIRHNKVLQKESIYFVDNYYRQVKCPINKESK